MAVLDGQLDIDRMVLRPCHEHQVLAVARDEDLAVDVEPDVARPAARRDRVAGIVVATLPGCARPDLTDSALRQGRAGRRVHDRDRDVGRDATWHLRLARQIGERAAAVRDGAGPGGSQPGGGEAVHR
jgi:hypothetical protein